MKQGPKSDAFRVVASSRRRPHHQPPRVLVAEDDDEMRNLVVQALREDGYDVRVASDGARLLAMLERHQEDASSEVDLVVTDVRMPVSTGLEIVERMRRADWGVPVVLMTSFADDDTRRRAQLAGAVLFDKPFALDDLRTAVLNIVPIG